MEQSVGNGDELSEEILVNKVLEDVDEEESAVQRNSKRQLFINMSQLDADLALARALQQQEHAYLLLHMGNGASEYETTGSSTFDFEYVHEEEEEEEEEEEQEELAPELATVQPSREDGLSLGSHKEDEDAEEEDIDGSLYKNDEAFARALQDAEHRDASAYMIGFVGVEETDVEDEDQSYGSEDAWQDMDPDNMSYEELVALGEAVGTHSRGLGPDALAALPFSKFVQDDDSSTSSEDPCVICRFEYEDGDCLSTLPCKHHYHTDCIKNWLEINKACPICNAEVTS